MDSRVAMISIIIQNRNAVEKINTLLSEYGSYIIGRMGIPYEKRGISMIAVMIDAPQNMIATLSGKLGALHGVTSKTLYSNVKDGSNETN